MFKFKIEFYNKWLNIIKEDTLFLLGIWVSYTSTPKEKNPFGI